MKIGFIEFNNLDTGGGTEFWLHDVIRFLKPRHETVVVTTTSSAHNARIKAPLIAEGTDVTEVAVVRRTSLPGLRGWDSIARLLHKCDVAYFIFSPGGLDIAVTLLSKLSGTPVIAGHHQPMTRDMFSGSTSVAQKSYYSVFGFRGQAVARLIEYHHVINRAAVDELRGLGYRSVELVPYGLHTTDFSPSTKAMTFTLLFMGRLAEQKGFDMLPEIVSRLSSQMSNFRLVIAGSGEGERVARAMSRDSRVQYVGFADTATRSKLLSESHVLLLPSRYEPFGLVGLEALSSGTPVVAFDNPGPRDYVIPGRTGYLAHDVSSLVTGVAQIHSLWNEGSSYDLMTRACRQHSLAFDWQVIGPRLEKMLVGRVSRESSNSASCQ